jgi:hypothetical protein
MLEREARDGDGHAEEAGGYCESLIIEGLRALRAFWYCFWADSILQYAVFPCIYCFMRGTGVRITLASA